MRQKNMLKFNKKVIKLILSMGGKNVPREIIRYQTLGEYNQSRLLAVDILTGKEFSRLRRKGKI